jgi:hypothetical protein
MTLQDLNLNLKAGWNAVYTKASGSATFTSGTGNASVSVSLSNPALQWVLISPGSFSIVSTEIIDYAPDITGPILSRSGVSFPTSVTLNITDSALSNINWRVNNSGTLTGIGSSFTLNAAPGGNIAFLLNGVHYVTVYVVKDGKPYNKTVTFQIMN